MREIKFRQPLTDKNGKFLEWFYWGFLEGTFVTPALQSNGIDPRNKSQQYTGVKDEKENEIYQDDILQDEEATYRVIWCENSCGWDLLRLQDKSQIGSYGCYSSDFFIDFVSNSVKIGTAYENPELLK